MAFLSTLATTATILLVLSSCVVEAGKFTQKKSSASKYGATAGGFSFVSIGDWGCVPIGGEREQTELAVAQRFMEAATEVNAQFVLNPGDNFYYCGVHGASDARFNSTYESVFTSQSTMVPWYSCLGNHDYGYPGSPEGQLAYKSPNNNRWQMPGRQYYKRLQFPGQVNISLMVLDASPCQKYYVSPDPSGWDPCGSNIPSCPGCTFHQNVISQNCTAQREWLKQQLTQVPADDWKIAMVHAPATELNVEDYITLLQGAGFQLYINGHVHLLAHYQVDGAGTYITSGAGCMVSISDYKKKQQKFFDKGLTGPVLGATSCTPIDPSAGHTCSIVFQKTVAGFTTHTFSSDFSTLTTNLVQVLTDDVKVIHTVVTPKSGQPVNPTSGPNPTKPPTPGKCCYYSDSYCDKGDVCCNESGNSYDESECKGEYGQKHDCHWSTTTQKCTVGY